MNTLRKYQSLLKETANAWQDDKASRMGAALAYYSIFSIAPLLLLAISVAGIFFGERAAKNQIHDQIAVTVGASAAGAIEEILKNVHQHGNGIVGTIVGLAVLFFGASGVFVELQDALNTIWKVKPKPGLGIWAVVRDRLFSFVIVLGTGFFLVSSLIVNTVLASIEQVVQNRLPDSGWLWSGVNLIISFGLVLVLFAVIYKVIPDTDVHWRDVISGALIAAILFTLGKYLIGLYLAKGAVASAFGAAGSVIIVLIWVYYSSQILLFGAEFTHAYACRTRSVAPIGVECDAN